MGLNPSPDFKYITKGDNSIPIWWPKETGHQCSRLWLNLDTLSVNVTIAFSIDLSGCPDGIDPVVVMNLLAEKGVTLYMVGCEPSVDNSRPFYMAMAHLTGGQYVPLSDATLLAKVSGTQMESMNTWWRHQMEKILALCAGTRSFDVFFDLLVHKRLNKQSWGWWFETPSCSLWRHCN